jgi:uroporphyrinogen-III synthase
MTPKPLSGRTIAIPETRELDLFAQMLEQRGADTVRCPLVSILDTPDQAPVIAWLKLLAADRFEDLVLFTGEGLKRLLAAAERAGVKELVIAALGRLRKITRGPKPARALRDIGLRSDLAAEQPTTDGVIAALAQLDLKGRNIGVQLYGSEPNLKLINFIRQAGATPYPVAPYIYASKMDDAKVVALIKQLALGEIDVIAFTSMQQITRLRDVAEQNQMQETLMKGLSRAKVAAVGPIVAEALKDIGARVDMMPEESYFMKPLVNAIVAVLGPDQA